MSHSRDPQSILIGIDLGGSYIKGGLVDPQGNVIASLTPRRTIDGKQVTTEVKKMVAELVTSANQLAYTPVGLGLATCGVVDPEQGLVLESTSIPEYRGTCWFEHLSAYQLPLAIENDARASTWAEFCVRHNRQILDWIHVPVGTSLACGIILGGQLLRGNTFSAGELGHITVEANGPACKCGNVGCLEGYISKSAIIRKANAGLEETAGSLYQHHSARPKFRDLSDVIAAAQSGNQTASGALADAGRYLGIGLTTLANLFNPQVITLGGGVVEASETVFLAAKDYVQRHALNSAVLGMRIEQGRLGNAAGFIGAALLAYLTTNQA